jgi:hypothetical protein
MGRPLRAAWTFRAGDLRDGSANRIVFEEPRALTLTGLQQTLHLLKQHREVALNDPPDHFV